MESAKHPKLAADDELKRDPQTFARSYQLEALEIAIKQNTIGEDADRRHAASRFCARDTEAERFHRGFSCAYGDFGYSSKWCEAEKKQARVLEMHTDLKVGQFYGDMKVDFWDASIWKKKLEQYEVFVMTPQILIDNLRHSFFQLDKIKLLIFDECHHARGSHPYSCIMTEYHYLLKSNSIQLPRIFGMTASLVCTKGSNNRSAYVKQIVEIESLMDSKVYTVASESDLAQYIPFSTPKIMLYTHVDVPFKLFCHLTDLLKNLKMKHLQALHDLMLDSQVEESTRKKIEKLHGTLIFCLTELGLWSAVKAAELLSQKENDINFWGERTDGICEKTLRKFSLEVVKVFSKYLPGERSIGENLKADTASGLLSSRVQCFIKSLMDYRMVHNFRCIVFVERVITAMVLEALLQEMEEISWWGIKYLAGNNSGLQSQTRKEQIKIVDSFQDGKVKILVTTSILEEGLDVQSCNVVIRFDKPTNVCSFIQSQGRARMQGSEYVLIIRSDDTATRLKVANYLNSVYIMREESLQQASLPCKPLESELYDEEFYRVEATGAKVTLSSCVSLIHFYCSRLPSDGYFKPYPRFDIDKGSNICTLHLPKCCPIPSIVVDAKPDKLKQIACLEATKKLHQIGALSDSLLPAFDEAVEDDAQESGSEAYNDEQPNYFPGEFVDSWSSFCCLGLYHCYMITSNQHFLDETSFSDVLLVVRSDLGADLHSYSFGLEVYRGSLTVDLKYVGLVQLSREQVVMGRRFQTFVLNVLIRHDFTEMQNALNQLPKKQSCLDVSYLLLPSIEGKIDWNCVQSGAFSMNKVSGHYRKHCICPSGATHLIQTIDGAMCRCMLQNSIAYTPHNGHFYCITGVLDTCNGNSSLKLKGGEVLTYKKHFKTSYGLDLKWEQESLLGGRHLFTVQNCLIGRGCRKEEEFSSAGVELPPELCKIIMTPISINTLYSFSFVPSIMHRIECLLLASTLKMIQLDHRAQNYRVCATKVLEAITTKKCQESFSLESLETLGDSFLKYTTSQYLFKSHEHHHQGTLTSKRKRLISNASLCRMGCTHNLTGFIRREKFDPKWWNIPGNCRDFNVDNQTKYSSQSKVYNIGTRCIKSKVIADSVEALIGAYLSSAGEVAAFHFLEWLGIEIDFRKETVVERPLLGRLEKFVNIKALEILLDYKFNDPWLLAEALTHGSYQVADIPRCYQRLEFLGDAVLDYLITVHLYKKYPGMTPGLITDLRSASVNNDCYAHAAAKAGLNKHILHASSELHRQMTFYLKNFTQSFSGSSHGWAAGVALPKVLADVIESIAGAIYIDSKSNKEVVWNSIRRLLEPMVTPETMELNPLRELNDLCCRKSYNKKFSKTFRDGVTSIVAEVEANGVVYREESTGINKEMAKKLVARDVLRTIKNAVSGLQH